VHWQKKAKPQLPSDGQLYVVAIQQPLKACDVHAAEDHMPAA